MMLFLSTTLGSDALLAALLALVTHDIICGLDLSLADRSSSRKLGSGRELRGSSRG